MTRHGARIGWWFVIPALLLGGWVIGSSMLARRGKVGFDNMIGGPHRVTPGLENQKAAVSDLPAAIVERMDNPRLATLRSAAETWKIAAAPRRVVVDQVWLVSDLPAFLEAIAAWDERHYFPILIDEPAWTLPFLRAFHPARGGAVHREKAARWIKLRHPERTVNRRCG